MRGEIKNKLLSKLSNRSALTAYIVIVFFVFLMSVFGKNGLIKLIRLSHIVSTYNEEIEFYKNENIKLSGEISALENDLYFIEKVARTEFGLAKPDEIIYIFKDEGKE